MNEHHKPESVPSSEEMEAIKGLIKLGTWIRLLIVGAFALGGWVGVLEFRTRGNTEAIELTSKTLAVHQKAQEQMEVWKAATEASRYTAGEANRTASAIYESLHLNDKRVTRVEDAVTQQQKSLDRIEVNIKQLIDITKKL